jgi:hypothetical protein
MDLNLFVESKRDSDGDGDRNGENADRGGTPQKTTTTSSRTTIREGRARTQRTKSLTRARLAIYDVKLMNNLYPKPFGSKSCAESPDLYTCRRPLTVSIKADAGLNIKLIS